MTAVGRGGDLSDRHRPFSHRVVGHHYGQIEASGAFRVLQDGVEMQRGLIRGCA